MKFLVTFAVATLFAFVKAQAAPVWPLKGLKTFMFTVTGTDPARGNQTEALNIPSTNPCDFQRRSSWPTLTRSEIEVADPSTKTDTLTSTYDGKCYISKGTYENSCPHEDPFFRPGATYNGTQPCPPPAKGKTCDVWSLPDKNTKGGNLMFFLSGTDTLVATGAGYGRHFQQGVEFTSWKAGITIPPSTFDIPKSWEPCTPVNDTTSDHPSSALPWLWP